MKEYMQPEVELVKFTSESVAIIDGVTGTGSCDIDEGDIVIPGT